MMVLQTELTEIQKSVADHFQKGGGILSMMLVMLGIAGIVALVAWLSRRQEKIHSPTTTSNPQKLFHGLLAKLDLTVQQRSLLKSVARDLRMPQPAALLISKELFSKSVKEWNDRTRASADRKAGPKLSSELVEQITRVLFPSRHMFDS